MNDTILTSFKEDQLNRKGIAQNLTHIISTKNKPLVISLDSGWGTGKTTFIHMWQDMLMSTEQYQKQFETIYFNAWENDYSKTPLIDIFIELETCINNNTPELKKAFDKMKMFFLDTIDIGSSIAIKLLTQGVLEKSDFIKDDNVDKEFRNLKRKLNYTVLSETINNKNLRKELKRAMSNYQKTVGKKIIFFIDELDRCRPPYTIELLEVIKHLFNIEGFAFILSIDKEQLSHSISSIYGTNMDTIGYLGRFLDIDFQLPHPDLRAYSQLKSDLTFSHYKNTNYFSFFLIEFIHTYNFSLRDINKLYNYLDLLLPLIPEFNKEFSTYQPLYLITTAYLYALLIILKFKAPMIYNQIINKNYDIETILDEIQTIDIKDSMTHLDQTFGFSSTSIQLFTDQLLKKYIALNRISNKINWTYIAEENDDFIVIPTNRQGNPIPSVRVELINFFTDNNIQSKLEFVDYFNLE